MVCRLRRAAISCGTQYYFSIDDDRYTAVGKYNWYSVLQKNKPVVLFTILFTYNLTPIAVFIVMRVSLLNYCIVDKRPFTQ